MRWRVSLAGRVISWVGIWFWSAVSATALLAAVGAFGGKPIPVALVTTAVGLAFVIYCYRMGIVPYVEAREDGIDVRNPFSRRFVAWSDVDSISATNRGLLIRQRSGGAVVPWAVQKLNRSSRRSRHTCADEVIDALMATVTARVIQRADSRDDKAER